MKEEHRILELLNSKLSTLQEPPYSVICNLFWIIERSETLLKAMDSLPRKIHTTHKYTYTFVYNFREFTNLMGNLNP